MTCVERRVLIEWRLLSVSDVCWVICWVTCIKWHVLSNMCWVTYVERFVLSDVCLVICWVTRIDLWYSCCYSPWKTWTLLSCRPSMFRCSMASSPISSPASSRLPSSTPRSVFDVGHSLVLTAAWSSALPDEPATKRTLDCTLYTQRTFVKSEWPLARVSELTRPGRRSLISVIYRSWSCLCVNRSCINHAELLSDVTSFQLPASSIYIGVCAYNMWVAVHRDVSIQSSLSVIQKSLCCPLFKWLIVFLTVGGRHDGAFIHNSCTMCSFFSAIFFLQN